MYRTSPSIRILSAALAAVFGLGLVATAGGALHEERVPSKTEAPQVVHLEPVVVSPHQPPHVVAGCEQAPKASM